MPSVPRSTAPRLRRHRAETAPHTASHTTSFRDPCSPIYCENTGIRTLPYFQTCTLSHACHANCNLLSYSIGWATSWPSYSSVSYLLVTLPLDCEWWVTSWWLYLLTALFSGELPLDYSTAWLSYSIVSYVLIIYHLTKLSQLFVTTEVSN